jgi:glyoxylase I family protein
VRPPRIHHVGIICSDYARSRHFYSEILGLPIIAQSYREARGSYKLELALDGGAQIELFSFPNPPPRASRPEACGLRHLAFAVERLDARAQGLRECGLAVEALRVDELTGRRYTFFADPDGLPLELYESENAISPGR